MQTIFRVARGLDVDESLLLDLLKEIGFTQMRVADGMTTVLQLQGMCSRIAIIAERHRTSSARVAAAKAGAAL